MELMKVASFLKAKNVRRSISYGGTYATSMKLLRTQFQSNSKQKGALPSVGTAIPKGAQQSTKYNMQGSRTVESNVQNVLEYKSYRSPSSFISILQESNRVKYSGTSP